jgi:Polyketide cyclase / dehydrase and lipid transport
MNGLLVATGCAAAVGAAAIGGYVGLVTGRLTIDLGIGRRTRPLGPLHVDIAAPRETVFAAAAAPYADRQPRAMREKVEILERAGQMVLAAHRTAVGSGLTAVTVETVSLDPPNRMGFRLLRGPVPYVIETFTFDDSANGTRFSYSGELGTDFWRLGQAWGDLVARSWVHAVRDSMAAIKTESERRAQG